MRYVVVCTITRSWFSRARKILRTQKYMLMCSKNSTRNMKMVASHSAYISSRTSSRYAYLNAKKLLWLLRPRRAEKGFKMKSSLENGLINYFHWSKLGIHVTLTWQQSLLYRCSYLMGSKWKEHQITEPSIADHQQRNCHICFISSTFSLKACSFLGNGLHYHNHCKIQV